MDKHTINTATLTRVCEFCAYMNMKQELSQIELGNALKGVKDFVQIAEISKLSNQELIDLTQNVEKLGQFIDYARVAVAGEIDTRGTLSFTGETSAAFGTWFSSSGTGAVAATSWYNPNTETENKGFESTGLENTNPEDTDTEFTDATGTGLENTDIENRGVASTDAENLGIEETRFDKSSIAGATSCSCNIHVNSGCDSGYISNHASGFDSGSGFLAGSPDDQNLDLASLAGCRDTRELIQRLTLAPIATINKQLRLAKALTPEVTPTGETLPVKYPAISYGLNKGVLPVETARLITDELNKIVREDNREKVLTAELLLVAATTGGDTSVVENVLEQGVKGFYEPELLDQVIESNTRLQEDFDSVKTMANIWAKAIEQESRPLTFDENIDKRFFRIGREKDGLVRIAGLLMPEIAALLGNLVTAVNSPRVNNNQDLGANETDSNTSASASDSASKVRFTQKSDEPTNENDALGGAPADTQRTHAQKSHDALALILQAAAKAAETPTLGGAPVTVLIEVKAKDLNKEQGFGLLHDHYGETHPTSLTQIRHGVCSGATQKIVTGDNGKIISLGNLERVFNHHQRRAITLRDKGCIIPGCSVPAAWCEIHHVTEHSKGGATHTSNGVTLCWWHHRNLDNSGWEIMMRDEYPWVKPPKWLNPAETWQKHEPQGVIPEILRS